MLDDEPGFFRERQPCDFLNSSFLSPACSSVSCSLSLLLLGKFWSTPGPFAMFPSMCCTDLTCLKLLFFPFFLFLLTGKFWPRRIRRKSSISSVSSPSEICSCVVRYILRSAFGDSIAVLGGPFLSSMSA